MPGPDLHVYRFRVVRKGINLADAQALVTKLSAQHPEHTYKIVMMDGALTYTDTDPAAATIYRVLMLRDIAA